MADITVEIPLVDSTQKLYYHEPNQRLLSQDLNRLSGSEITDSMFSMFAMAMRASLGLMPGDAPAYYPQGFKITATSPTQITIGKGILIGETAIYEFEGAILTPTPEAHYGIYEFELVSEYTDLNMKKFIDPISQNFLTAAGNTRKAFRLRLFEKYNELPIMPTVTPGNIQLIEYKKTASLGTLVSQSNVLSKTATPTNGATGDVKYSMLPGDGDNWLTLDGSDVPSQHTDLIDLLKGLRCNPATLTGLTISNNGSGFVRINFASAQNLKNLLSDPDPRHTTIEILSSTNTVALPKAIYRLINKDAAGMWIDILHAYSSASTISLEIRPFAKADIDGGGARLPLPNFIRAYNPSNPLDVNRLPYTYQSSQNKQFTLTDSGHNHSINHGGDAINGSIDNGGMRYDASNLTKNTTPSFSNISINDTYDPDNPNQSRPENLALYILIKT